MHTVWIPQLRDYANAIHEDSVKFFRGTNGRLDYNESDFQILQKYYKQSGFNSVGDWVDSLRQFNYHFKNYKTFHIIQVKLTSKQKNQVRKNG